MNLITCWGCGVVLNKDAVNFPDIFDDDGDWIEGNSVYDRENGNVSIAKCPVCGGDIREDGECA